MTLAGGRWPHRAATYLPSAALRDPGAAVRCMQQAPLRTVDAQGGRGAGIVAARTPKKVLQMAGIEDCYTASRGHTRTLGNFVKATFAALENTYGFLTPELWKETKFKPSPLQEFTDLLAKPYVAEKRAPAPAF